MHNKGSRHPLNTSGKKPIELLAPASNLLKVKIALHYGADAVYVGAKQFSLRHMSDNLDVDELGEAVLYAHQQNKKIYLACNAFLKQSVLDDFEKWFDSIKQYEFDAYIVSDPAAIAIIKKIKPDACLHLSTQANTVNSIIVNTFRNMGVSRFILARELGIEEIRQIYKQTQADLEVFVHGAMCLAYSGRCLLSYYFTFPSLAARTSEKHPYRNANEGRCVQPCRWEFNLQYSQELSRPEQILPAEPIESGTLLLSSKDLCLINHLPALAAAGIRSFKIEGRMKSIYYIANTVRCYRKAIDELYLDNQDSLMPLVNREIKKISHREYSTGFFFRDPLHDANIVNNESYRRSHRLIGYIKQVTDIELYEVHLFNKIEKTQNLEIIGPEMKNLNLIDFEILNNNKESVEFLNHSQECYIRSKIPLALFDILRIPFKNF